LSRLIITKELTAKAYSEEFVLILDKDEIEMVGKQVERDTRI